jgi:siroheme synthase-like protein
MPRLPLALDLNGRRVVVVGGGPVAQRKVAALLAAGAEVVVIAPELTAELAQLAQSGALAWLPRPYQPGDLAGAWLVLAATNRGEVNRAVAAEAEAQRLWCNVAAPPQAGSCHVMAQVAREGVMIALATDGASPYAARRLRQIVEAAVPPELARLAALIGEQRAAVQARWASEPERAAAYDRLWECGAAGALAAGDEQRARALLAAAIG